MFDSSNRSCLNNVEEMSTGHVSHAQEDNGLIETNVIPSAFDDLNKDGLFEPTGMNRTSTQILNSSTSVTNNSMQNNSSDYQHTLDTLNKRTDVFESVLLKGNLTEKQVDTLLDIVDKDGDRIVTIQKENATFYTFVNQHWKGIVATFAGLATLIVAPKAVKTFVKIV